MNLIGFTMFQANRPFTAPLSPLVANLFDATKPAQHPIYSQKTYTHFIKIPSEWPKSPLKKSRLFPQKPASPPRLQGAAGPPWTSRLPVAAVPSPAAASAARGLPGCPGPATADAPATCCGDVDASRPPRGIRWVKWYCDIKIGEK